jgi:hypothetical protein
MTVDLIELLDLGLSIVACNFNILSRTQSQGAATTVTEFLEKKDIGSDKL